MPRMKSLIVHHFFNRKLEPGSEFEATDSEARVLIALGRAQRVDEKKAMQAETPAEIRAKRPYRRRDITQRETK